MVATTNTSPRAGSMKTFRVRAGSHQRLAYIALRDDEPTYSTFESWGLGCRGAFD